MTYSVYCKEMSISLRNETLSDRDKRTLFEIFQKLEPIFSLKMDEAAEYIAQFFEFDVKRIHDFEKSVRITKDLFPFTGDS